MFVGSTRFNINSYLRKPSKIGGRRRIKPKSKPIANAAFKKLEQKAKPRMQKILSASKSRKNLKNKSLTHFFLDKVSTLQGSWNPSNEIVSQHTWGSSTWASMEMIRYLSLIKDDNRLNPETKELIYEWIEQEKDYLPIAIVLDGIRSSNQDLVDHILPLTPETKAKPYKVEIDPKEIEDLAVAFVEHLHNLPSGNSFKMLGGHVLQETRLVITKKKDATFSVYHFNTRGGATEASSFTIPSAGTDKLLDPKWWQTLIKLKLEKDYMYPFDKHLSELGDQIALPLIYQKALQKSDTCPTKCIEAELKQFIISNQTDEMVGLEQYKIIKSLMAEVARTTRDDEIVPELVEIFRKKESIRHRFLDRHELVKDIKEYENTKNAYIKAICSMQKNSIEKKDEIEEIVSKKTPLMALSFLDWEFEKQALNLSEEKYHELLKSHEVIKKPEINAGLKREYILEDLRKGIEWLIIHKSSLTNNIKPYVSPFLSYLPVRLRIAISKYLFEKEISEISLVSLIRRYMIMESKDRFIKAANTLKELNVLNDRIIKDIYFDISQNIDKLNTEQKQDTLHKLYELIKDNESFAKEREMIEEFLKK